MILIPSVSVPASLVGTFGVMHLCGFSLDNLSLMALTISTGFLVDDAVVVIENITRHLEHGMPPMEAAFKGAQGIGFTVVSMSMSLIAVFNPRFSHTKHETLRAGSTLGAMNKGTSVNLRATHKPFLQIGAFPAVILAIFCLTGCIGNMPQGNSLQMKNSVLPAGAAKTAYVGTLSATGGKPPYSWGVTNGIPSRGKRDLLPGRTRANALQMYPSRTSRPDLGQ